MLNRRNKPVTQIKILGYPTLAHDGIALKFPTRKALALFVYLLVEAKQQSREKLMDIFWGESSFHAAAASLRTELSRLRRVLAPTSLELNSDKQSVALTYKGNEIDVIRLNSAFHTVAGASPGAISGEALTMILDLLPLLAHDFLGDFVLDEGTAFAQWAQYWRQEYRQKINAVFAFAAKSLIIQHDDLSRSEIVARQWVQRDPFYLAAHETLIQILETGNDQAALLTAVSAYREAAAELGIETNARAARLANEASRTNSWGKPAVSPPAQLPFVGRASHLQALKISFSKARLGQSQAVSIIGESGIGKSRLAREFLRWADAIGATILTGQAFAYGDSFPYQPIIDALRERIDRENAPEDLLNDVWLSELSRLFPELRDRYPDLPPYTSESGLVKPHLFEAILQLTLALGKRNPLILFLDDMQWADEISRELIVFLARRWQRQNAPVLLAISLRVENLESQPAIADWLIALDRATNHKRLTLAALTESDVAQLLAEINLAQQDFQIAGDYSSTVAWVWRETQGNAFFLSEIVAWLQEARDEKFAETPFFQFAENWGYRGLPLTETIFNTIASRINHLTEGESNALLAAAVMERVCTFAELKAVTKLDNEALVNAVEQLLRQRFLLETGKGYVVAHNKLQKVTYVTAGASRQRIYHRRVFHAIKEKQIPANGEIAHHALKANLVLDAFVYSIRAGDEALRIFAVNEAVKHFEQAFQLLPQLKNQASAGDCEQLFICYGRSLEYKGEYHKAVDIYREMESYASEHGHDSMKLKAQNREATLYVTLTPVSDPERGESISLAALSQARQQGNRAEEVVSLWNLLNAHRIRVQNKQAIAYGEQALNLAGEQEDQQILGYILTDMCQVYSSQGTFPKAILMARKALAVWEALGNRAMVVDSLASIAFCRLFQGDFSEAISLGEKGARIGQSIENIWGQTYCQLAVGWAYRYLGEDRRAQQIFQTIVRSGDEIGLPIPRVYGRMHLAEMEFAAGNRNAAVDLAAAALEIGRKTIPTVAIHAEVVLCLLYLYAGEFEKAAALAAQMPIGVKSAWIPFEQYYIAVIRALLLAHEEKLDEAVSGLHTFLEGCEESNLRISYCDALIVLGKLQASQGKAKAARQTLETALSMAKAIKSPLLQNRAAAAANMDQ